MSLSAEPPLGLPIGLRDKKYHILRMVSKVLHLQPLLSSPAQSVPLAFACHAPATSPFFNPSMCQALATLSWDLSTCSLSLEGFSSHLFWIPFTCHRLILLGAVEILLLWRKVHSPPAFHEPCLEPHFFVFIIPEL